MYKNKVKVGLDSTANTQFVQIVKINKNETETAFFTCGYCGRWFAYSGCDGARERVRAFRISNMCALCREMPEPGATRSAITFVFCIKAPSMVFVYARPYTIYTRNIVCKYTFVHLSIGVH